MIEFRLYKLLKCDNTTIFFQTNLSCKKAKTLLIPPPNLFLTYTAKAAKMCQPILLIFYYQSFISSLLLYLAYNNQPSNIFFVSVFQSFPLIHDNEDIVPLTVNISCKINH